MKTDNELRDELIQLWLADLNQHETGGANRSPMIDNINRRLHVPLGSPYCIGGLLVRGVEVLCTKNKLINPVVMSAGTQDFWQSTPTKFKRNIPLKGDICILQNRTDSSHGHAYGITTVKDGKHLTVEYNTNKAGSRDGDGVYELTRTDKGSLTKKYLGAVDVISWILTVNNMTLPIEPVVAPPIIRPRASLHWEDTCTPDKLAMRKAWSDHLMKQIDMSIFDKAVDTNKLYPNFKELANWQQHRIIAEMFVALAFYESAYNPNSESVDVGTEADKNTWSVGLFQLSVSDKVNKTALRFSYFDLKDPLKNMILAVAQMHYQILNTGRIFLLNDNPQRYWSTILIGNKYNKIDQVIKRVTTYAKVK
jgi:hypothetical protein